MKRKFSPNEKKCIVEEAEGSKKKKHIAEKHNIHLSTLYGWISEKININNRTEFVGFKVSKKEKDEILKKSKILGYENDLSSYMRNLVFKEYMIQGNPKEWREELYKARGEMSKIGSNINQIANYTNFLSSNGYINSDFMDNLIRESGKIYKVVSKHKEIIDNALRKIFN